VSKLWTYSRHSYGLERRVRLVQFLLVTLREDVFMKSFPVILLFVLASMTAAYSAEPATGEMVPSCPADATPSSDPSGSAGGAGEDRPEEAGRAS
jgi:hypothetical protein